MHLPRECAPPACQRHLNGARAMSHVQAPARQSIRMCKAKGQERVAHRSQLQQSPAHGRSHRSEVVLPEPRRQHFVGKTFPREQRLRSSAHTSRGSSFPMCSLTAVHQRQFCTGSFGSFTGGHSHIVLAVPVRLQSSVHPMQSVRELRRGVLLPKSGPLLPRALQWTLLRAARCSRWTRNYDCRTFPACRQR
jgi:hypothetical protein